MDNMNWGTWLRGLIASVSNGGLTVLAAIVALQEFPDPWKLFVIGGVPFLFNFFSYIKQSPPPFGYKVVVDPDVPVAVQEKIEEKIKADAPPPPQPTVESIMKELGDILVKFKAQKEGVTP